jgi:SAM-dependent methyltransferase
VVDEARRTSFDRAAELYDQARPSYPPAMVDALIARCNPRRMLEIGAGTGKATQLFASTQRELVAIEPAPALAAILRRHVGGLAHVTIEETTFESYTGDRPAFDLVYAAQAFHWIDPATKYAKVAQVLRTGGTLAVITNEKGAVPPGVREAFDDAYARWSPGKPRPPDEIEDARESWTTEIAASGVFGFPEVLLFPWTASYTASEYTSLVETYSDTLVLPAEKRVGLTTDLARAIDAHGGRLVVPYVAMVFVATTR